MRCIPGGALRSVTRPLPRAFHDRFLTVIAANRDAPRSGIHHQRRGRACVAKRHRDRSPRILAHACERRPPPRPPVTVLSIYLFFSFLYFSRFLNQHLSIQRLETQFRPSAADPNPRHPIASSIHILSVATRSGCFDATGSAPTPENPCTFRRSTSSSAHPRSTRRGNDTSSVPFTALERRRRASDFARTSPSLRRSRSSLTRIPHLLHLNPAVHVADPKIARRALDREYRNHSPSADPARCSSAREP